MTDVKFLAGFAGLLVLLGIAGTPNEPSKPRSPDTDRTCRDNWKMCKDNSDLANHSAEWWRVKSACRHEADNQYGMPEWVWLEFSIFLPGSDYVQTGRVTAIENDARFGATAHVIVRCEYDLHQQHVLNVSITPRQEAAR